MLFLLYALCCSAVVGTATYYVVYRTALFQRALAAALRKGLRRLLHSTNGDEDLDLVYTDSGIRLRNATLSADVLGQIDHLYIDISCISVDSLDVSFPTWSRPLSITISSPSVELVQRSIPRYTDPSALEALTQVTSRQITDAKLDAVEKLLWGHIPRKPGKAERGFGSRMRARVVHRALVIAVQYVSFDASNIQLLYKQSGVPGPRPPEDSPLQGMDAICLDVRKLSLTPQEAPRMQAAAEAGNSEFPPDAEAPPPGASLCYRAMCIPRWIWRKIAVHMPVSSRLLLAGVCVSLREYQQPTAEGSSNSGEPAQAASTSHIANNARVQEAATPSQPPPVHTRQQQSASTLRQRQQRNASTSSASQQQAASRSGSRQQQHGAAAGHAETALQSPPGIAATHTLLRQWGAEVTVTILPPGWDARASPDAQNTAEVQSAPGQTVHLHTRALNRLNSIWESQEGSGDDGTPTSSSGVRSLFNGQSNGHPGHGQAEPGSPGLLFTNRQTNPLYNDKHSGSPDPAGQSRPPPKAPEPPSKEHSRQSSGSLPQQPKQQKASAATVSFDVRLRSFVLAVSTDSVCVGIRMMDRFQQYQQHAQLWQGRPQVDVAGNSEVWWKHAGSNVRRECHLISRRQVPLCGLERRRKLRLEYCEAYKRTHHRFKTFRDPDKSWWSWNYQADASDKAVLQQLEQQLTVEEVAHFRAFVAARNSTLLARSEEHLQHAVDAVDAVVANLGPLPQGVEALLLHSDNVEPPLVLMFFKAECPKVGVSLELAEDWHQHTSSNPDTMFYHLEAAIKHISADIRPSGDMEVRLQSIGVGGLSSPDTPLVSTVLQSPSAHCNQLLRIADLQSVAIREESFVPDEAASISHMSVANFLVAKIGFKPGEIQSPPVAGPPITMQGQDEDAHVRKRAMLRPPGLAIQLRVAGVQLLYNSDVVGAALGFFNELLHHKSHVMESTGCVTDEPGQPRNLTERVLHSFARHDIPVDRPVSLPLVSLDMYCPGIVLCIPYTHTDTVNGGPSPLEASTSAAAAGDSYELIAALTRLRGILFGEDFQQFLRGGATQRYSLTTYLDLFCYQPPEHRKRGSQHAGLQKVFRSPEREALQRSRRISSASSQGSVDDDNEMEAMAKVWAHPEDLHLFPGMEAMDNLHSRSTEKHHAGKPRRSSIGSTLWKEGRNALLRGQTAGTPAFSLVPLAKVSAINAEISQKIYSLPAAPGATAISCAVAVVGMQIWLSPWQVAHVLSIVSFVESTLHRVIGPEQGVPPTTPISLATPTDQALPTGLAASAMKTQLRLTLSAEIPLISVLCLVARTDDPEDSNTGASAQYSHIRRQKARRLPWAPEIAETDMAYAWSKCLAPVYAFNLIGLRASCKYRGTGEAKVGAKMDGLLTRDLQLRPEAKFAFFLRPLPARAKQLSGQATLFRRRLLKVDTVPKARRRWYKVVRMVVMRQRCTRQALKDAPVQPARVHTNTVPFQSFFGSPVSGPQFSLVFIMHPPAKYPGHPEFRAPPPAELDVEVGQMLFHARFAKSNRMLPFTTQIIEVVAAHYPSNIPTPADMVEAVMDQATEPTLAAPVNDPDTSQAQTGAAGAQLTQQTAFPGLQARVGIVGVNLVALVESRELLSFKILDATVDASVAGPTASARDPTLTIGAAIQHMSIRDLQAEHHLTMVLQPNPPATSCSLALEFNQWADSSIKPSLVIELANAQFLLLFRFMHDIMHGVDIIMASIQPALAAASPVSRARSKSNLVEPAEDPELIAVPIRMAVYLTNTGIILPASSKSHQVVAGNIDSITLGMPGSALSDMTLADVELPNVEEMVADSLDSCCLFKRAAPVPEAPPQSAFNNAKDGDEDPLQDLDPANPLSGAGGKGRAGVDEGHRGRLRRRRAAGIKPSDQVVSALKKVKSTLGIGKPDKYDYGGGTFPKGVITVDVPNYQHHRQQSSHPGAPLLHPGDPLPNLPTPFAAAQVPLPDQKQFPGTPASSATADPIPLGGLTLSPTARKASGPPTGPRTISISPLPRSAAGQQPAVKLSGRLGSAPPGTAARAQPSSFAAMPSMAPAGTLRRLRTSPHLDSGGATEAKLAILAEGFVVERAMLTQSPTERVTDFVPASVHKFAHSRAKWELTDRGRYLLRSHYSMVMLEQPPPPGCKGPPYLQMHLATAPATLIINNANYTALLAFCEGNLKELSAMPNSGGSAEETPKNTTFNPDFRFGPPKGVPPTFRMTLDVPEFLTLFEADPQMWQTGSFHNAASRKSPVMPFAQGVVRNIRMDLVQLEGTGNTHMIISADSINIGDLRLAYSQIMNNHLNEEPTSSSSSGYDKNNLADILPNDSGLVNRMPAGTLPKSKDTPVCKLKDTSATGLRQSISTRHMTDPKEAARDRDRARAAFHRTAESMHKAHEGSPKGAGPSEHTPPAKKKGHSRGKSGALPGVKPRPEGIVQQAGELMPIISMEMVPELIDLLPDGTPVVHLLQCPYTPPTDEGQHLKNQPSSSAQAQDRIEVQLSVLDDGTLAIEANVHELLAQWPYLSDLSLIWSVASIFQPQSVDQQADPAHNDAALAASKLLQGAELQPWLYFNLIAHDSHMFVPVLDLAVMRHAVEHYFGGGSELLNMHERLADLLLIALSVSFEDAELGTDIEERGLAINWSTFRFAICQGGDGESDMTMDVQDIAMFVRDPGSVVTCILLPLSCSMHMHQQAPQAEARMVHMKKTRMVAAAVVIQRWWRHQKWAKSAEQRKRDRQTGAGRHGSRQLDAALAVAEQIKRPILRMPNKEEVAAIDRLIMEVASPRTKRLLQDYKVQSKTNGDAFNKGWSLSKNRKYTRTMKMQLKVGALTMRAAFSHIPFWQSTMWMVQQIILQPCPGNIATGGSVLEQMDKMMEDFQSSTTEVEATIQTAAVVLCNDKPQTFGAPDVLQVTASRASAHYTMTMFFPDRPPNQAVRVGLAVSASFLNNSSSRWEAICESWAVEAEMVDTVSPIYRSDHHRHMWIASKERLNVRFNPASLLSFGDALAFANTLLSNEVVVLGPQGPEVVSSPHGPGSMARLAAPENAPKISEQMAVNADLTSRIPQKYLIQNQSGLRVYYWADNVGDQPPDRSFGLSTGVSETLKVEPARRLLNIMMNGKHGSAKKVGNVINLHFEGNWMPIQDVAVSVVGKYCYHMHSPAEHRTLPVIVDIILVGRTKIITLHSSIWLTNNTDRHLAFRLHVPITPLVAPARVGPPNRKQRSTDQVIGPLDPGAGTYLPLTAVLGGLLFVRPDGFMEADRDVIRLDPDVGVMQAQQGYVCCPPTSASFRQGRDTYVPALHCSVRVLPSQINSEFQTFKHIECLAPGELMRAHRPLEATVAIHPTLVLTNALPYDMDIVVWQVKPFRKLRKVHNQGKRTRMRDLIRYDLRQMHAAFTGTLPVGSKAENSLGGAHATHKEADLTRTVSDVSLRRDSIWQAGAPTVLQPFEDSTVQSSSGQHINVILKPGASQDVYADMSNNLLVHVHVPALGLRSKQWTVISWARSQTARESLLDAKYVYRLSNQIILSRPVRSSLSKSLAKLNPAESIARLKEAGRKVREHLQRPTLERNFDPDSLFHDSESEAPDLFTQTAQLPSSPVLVASPRQSLSQEAAAADTAPPNILQHRFGGIDDPASGSDSDVPLPSISEGVLLQAPDPLYRRHVDFASSSNPAIAPNVEEIQPVYRPPISPFENSSDTSSETSSVQLTAPGVLSDQPILGAGAGQPDPPQLRSDRQLPPSRVFSDAQLPPGTTQLPPRSAQLPASSPQLLPSRLSHVSQAGPSRLSEESQLAHSQLSSDRQFVASQLSPDRQFVSSEVPSNRPVNSIRVGDRLYSSDKHMHLDRAPERRFSSDRNLPMGRLSDVPVLEKRSSKQVLFPEQSAGSRKFSRQKSVKPMTKKDKQTLRMVFEAWREYSVEMQTRRFRKDLPIEQRGGAPPLMMLGVDNSMHDKASDDLSMCKLTLFAPYWIDNRSGLDLMFKDGPSGKGQPLLMGAHTIFDYALVKAPGIRGGEGNPSSGPNSNPSTWDYQLAQVQPVLLNKQDDISFSLANPTKKNFSRRVQITTVGGKGGFKIKGPEPVQALGEIMRHNLGCIIHPRANEQDKEPAQQPNLVARVTGDDEPKAVGVSLEQSSGKEGVKLHLEALHDPEPGSSRGPLSVRTSMIEVPPPDTSGRDGSLGDRHSLGERTSIVSSMNPDEAQQPGFEAMEEAMELSDSDSSHHHEDGEQDEARHSARGQRQYEFAVEVTAGPPNSVFRHTKVITVKSKYVVENQAGMPIEIKQRGTPDLDVQEYGSSSIGRCSRRLEMNERCAIHWDDAALRHELMVRPAATGPDDPTWQWSGGFKLSDREEYYGLRVRQERDPAQAINLPVSTTVGPSGSLLVTFKSRLSVPPYRIENMSSDVVIFFAQRGVAHQRGKWNWLMPAPGGAKMAYAWDEPIADHVMTIRAREKGRMGQSQAAHYNLDKLGVQAALHLPSMDSAPGTSGNLEQMQTLQANMPDMSDDVKQRLASLLAAEFSKKVYVSVYADGPTRVLRFADEKSTALLEAEQSVLDLAARLKQVEGEVKEVNSKFARLRGLPNMSHTLDLYGRSFSLGPTPEAARPNTRTRRSGRTSQGPRLKLKNVRMAALPRTQSGVLSEEPPGRSLMRRLSDKSLGSNTPEKTSGLARSKSHNQLREQSLGPDDEAAPEVPSKSFTSQGSSDWGAVQAQEQPPPRSPPPATLLSDAGHLAPHTHATPQTVQGSDLMRFAAAGDATLLIGGDLIVTVCQAKDLNGMDRSTHPFVRATLGDQGLQTSVQWQTTSPHWEEALSFREVTAAGELLVEVWDLGGQARGSKQLKKLADNPSEVINKSRFLGRAEIPLVNTLVDTQRGTKSWYPLMRRDGKDAVGGQLRLAFAWDVTARSLMSLMLKALEHVLQQRREILCMLAPVSPHTAMTWSTPGSSAASTATLQAEAMGHEGMAAKIMAKHSREEHRSSLHVTVVEARGLRPRHGVGVAFQANDLPNPLVEVSAPRRPAHTFWTKHTLNPKFPATGPAVYDKLPSDSVLTFKFFDNKGTLTKRRRRVLLGSNHLCCTHFHGEDPIYIWLPMRPPATFRYRRRHGLLPPPGQIPDLQVLVRLQWVMEVMRGQSTHMEVSLEGLATSVMGGLQDELFNLTLDNLQVSGHMTRLEATLSGSIRRVQLDNQMLDATQPVVLASASVAHARSDTAQSLVGDEGPLVSFGFTRSFANTIVASGEHNSAAANPSPGNRVSATAGASSDWDMGKTMGDTPSAILSFKDIHLRVGEMDFQADDGFLEAILSFVVSIPTADIWQDEAWRQQQRRLLTAQFGPKEVESLVTNAVLPIQDTVDQEGDPLQWVIEKELHELEVMRGHSSYTSWYFVERIEISNINVNVTISLSSSILSTHAPGSISLPENRGGLFSRVIGASGFQLINVNNVPLQLSGWSTDTKLIGRKALQGSLTRHYIGQSIKEAHKVLGGAGPAIAAVPLTVVWAGTSAVSLLNNIRTRQVGPVGAVQRVGFVLFTGVAQIISAFSRMGAAIMTYLPPNRTGHLTDRSMLTRAVQRPANAPDAFRSAFEEAATGILAGLAGTMLDPVQGYHSGSFLVSLLGIFKAVVGILIRPTVGICEFGGKSAYGIGLLFLGREGISGTIQKRVRAPGTLTDDSEELIEEVTRNKRLQRWRAVMAAWQRVLPDMFPLMKDDRVLEVLRCRSNRVLLLTSGHVALLHCTSKPTDDTVMYKSKWNLRLNDVQNVRGNEDKMQITIQYVHVYKFPLIGAYNVPLHKYIKCSSFEIYSSVIARLNRHRNEVAQRKQRMGNSGEFDLPGFSHLSIMEAADPEHVPSPQ